MYCIHRYTNYSNLKLRHTSIVFAESKVNQLHQGFLNTGLDIIFGISSFITLLVVVCLILAVITCLLKRRACKGPTRLHRSEPINFASLERADENAYQKVDSFHLTLKNVSLPEEGHGNIAECSEVPKCVESDM